MRFIFYFRVLEVFLLLGLSEWLGIEGTWKDRLVNFEDYEFLNFLVLLKKIKL